MFIIRRVKHWHFLQVAASAIISHDLTIETLRMNLAVIQRLSIKQIHYKINKKLSALKTICLLCWLHKEASTILHTWEDCHLFISLIRSLLMNVFVAVRSIECDHMKSYHYSCYLSVKSYHSDDHFEQSKCVYADLIISVIMLVKFSCVLTLVFDKRSKFLNTDESQQIAEFLMKKNPLDDVSWMIEMFLNIVMLFSCDEK